MNGEVISLSQATKFIVDNRGKTAPTSKDGIPLIATNCIDSSDLYPAYKNVRYVSRDTYDNWFRSHPKPDDIIITLKGSKNGAVCLVPNPVDFAIAQDMVALRADEDIIYPYYLFAALRSREVQHQIKTLDVSGVIPHLKKTDFNKLIFPYPSREVQKQIGDTYYAFCNKIELLREQNKTLETLAQTIFKEWFVNFNYPDLSACGSPAQADATGEMVDSELDEIPKGWRVGKFGDVVNIKQGKYVKADKISDSITGDNKHPIYGGNGIRGYIDSYMYETPQVILTCRGNGCGLILLAEKESTITNSCMAFEDMNSKLSASFLYFLTTRINFESVTSGSAQPQITVTNLYGLEIVVPEERVLKEFDSCIEPFLDKVRNNTAHIQELSKTRDALLPKLMSGKVRVNT